MAKLSIKQTEFDGLEAVEITTAKARLIALTAMGPRIAWFGSRRGRNLLFWDYARKYSRGDWRLMGGHRVWATRPLGDEPEESYADDNEPCALRVLKDGVELRGAVHPVFKTSKTIIIKVLDDASFQVENRITNHSEMIWSGGVWGLTCTLPKATTTYGIPLGRHGAWDIFSIVIPKSWGGTQSVPVNDPGIRYTEDCLILKPTGKRTSKRMVQAFQGVMGMTDPGEKLSFIKRSAYVDGANYPWNCNLAYYAGKKNFMVEMETLGPDQSVLPGASIATRETWMLRKPVNWARLKGPFSGD